MRIFYLILISIFMCIDGVNAAVRDTNTRRNTSPRYETNTVARSTTPRRTITQRPSVKSQNTNARTATKKIVTGRSATQKKPATRKSLPTTRSARSATNIKTYTFGNNYNSCRDTYFTCMDQFCATVNESYRRCVCSSKLKDIQNTEKLLSQTSDSIKNFEDLNINAISKSATEVKAMISETKGESGIKKDLSSNADTLQNISSILDDAKKKSLSTAGKLDAGGDIKSIWSTTDLIGGSDIANLTGESLYNAVHYQCAELVSGSCANSDLQMISSAYGMYIENDCAVLQNNLDSKLTSANAAIRTTRHKMQDARLENYDAHNSLNVNDCIAKVRNDITADTACGKEYIHCLDFSGKYINATTGDVIYTPEFYQIENQISLSGDILTNTQNSSFITMLNKKRSFAEKNLDLCTDDADYVWNEFLRQALIEIYQGQQKRVESVKNECLEVVNTCYLQQSQTLKNFTDTSSKMIFAQTLELSEEMCKDKLDTCSNLYGGGPDGLNILVATMTGITDLAIEQSCPDLLNQYAKSICAVQEGDSLHSYPYGCRKYAPGESHYARIDICNTTFTNPFSRSDILQTQTTSSRYTDYIGYCQDQLFTKRYTSCKVGYYLYNEFCSDSDDTHYCPNNATECRACPPKSFCSGGTNSPVGIDDELYQKCGEYYIGSLYQQLVIYAMQNCTRTSNTSNVPSESLLTQIDKIAKNIRTSLIIELSTECSNLSGIWVDAVWTDENEDGFHDKTGDTLLNNFYISTGANKLWGYCKDITQ